MNLSPNLTLEEFVSSQAAARNGIDNSLPDALLPDARLFATSLFEPIRHLLGDTAVIVSSGYRCERVNQVVGGAPTSAHVQALAGDLLFPKLDLLEAYLAIAEKIDTLPVDQLIYEFGSWVHAARPPVGVTPRRQLLMKFVDTGYLPFDERIARARRSR